MRDLYLMDADGGNVRRVFKKAAHRISPTWAPDGKQIAYERGNVIYIATLGRAGRGGTRCEMDFDLAWSPDGTEIAYSTDVFGSNRLTIINVQHTKAKAASPTKEARAWQHMQLSWSATGETKSPFLGTRIHHYHRTGCRVILSLRDGRISRPFSL